MLKNDFTLWAAFLGLSLAAATGVDAQGRPANPKLAQLPPPVRNTIRAQMAGGKLDDITKTTGDGETFYEVEITREGKTRGFTVGGGGALLDQEVFLDEIPPAVQKTIRAQLGKGTLGQINKQSDDGDVEYDVEKTENGQTRNFTTDERGELLGMQVFLDETPAAAQRTIRAQIDNGQMGEITRRTDDGDITYDVELTRDGKTRTFTVSDKGDLLEMEVVLEETPVAVQKSLLAQSGTGNIDGINKTTSEDGTNYVADVSDGTKSFSVTVDANGAAVSREETVALADAPESVQKTIKGLEGNLLGISKTTAGSETSYTADLLRGNKRYPVDVAADGKVIPDDQ